MAKSPKILSTSFLVVFVVLLVYLLFWIFAPFLTSILWALILARLFSPLHERLASLMRGQRVLSAVLMTLAVIALIVLPVSYVTVLAVTETIHAYEVGLAWVQAGGMDQLPERLRSLPLIGTLSEEVLGKIIVAYGVLHGPTEGGTTMSQVVAGKVGGLASNMVESATNFLITFFTLFFLFRDGPRLYRTVHQALP